MPCLIICILLQIRSGYSYSWINDICMEGERCMIDEWKRHRILYKMGKRFVKCGIRWGPRKVTLFWICCLLTCENKKKEMPSESDPLMWAQVGYNPEAPPNSIPSDPYGPSPVDAHSTFHHILFMHPFFYPFFFSSKHMRLLYYLCIPSFTLLFFKSCWEYYISKK